MAALWTCACAIGLLSASAHAELRRFHFQHIVGSHGLAQNTVSALLQDRDGYIWVATQGGLHRYDGQDYRLFEQLPGDANSLPDNVVTALAEGEPGELWIGMNSAYVARFDLATGHFQNLLPAELDQPSQLGKRVLALFYQHDHGLWITSEGGIDLLDPSSGQRHSVLRQPTTNGFQNSYGYVSDASGMVWATTPGGLYRIDPVTLKIQHIADVPGLQNILRDRQGALWIAADGLYRLDPATATLQRRWSAHDVNDWLREIAQDAQGNLWLATARNGLIRYDPGSGASIRMRSSDSGIDGLPADDARALMIDRSGLLWIGTETSGVITTQPQGSRFQYLFDPDPAHNQRYTNSVRSLYEAGAGKLWIGTDGDGIKRYDFATDTFDSYTPALLAAMPVQSVARDLRILAIRPAAGGSLWVASNFGLYRLDPATRRASLQTLSPEAGAGADQPLSVHALANAADGGLWVGTQTEGLFKLDEHGRSVQHIGIATATTPGLSNLMITSLYEDSRAQLWIGSMDGLDRLQIRSGAIRHFLSDARDPHTLSGNRVRVIEPARNGALWIGTHSGLNRLLQRADGSVQIDRFLPRPEQTDVSTTIYGILEDADGNLWLSTNNGVLRFNPAQGSFRHFGSSDGLQHLEFNGGAQLRLADGRMAFGGIRGLNLFDPAGIRDNRYAPNVVLTSLRVGSATQNRVGLLAPPQLEFNQSEGVLRLHFSALDFADPGATQYRYRLDGFDHGWIDADHHPDATYTNLNAGHYVFRAQATNRDGVWSSRPLTLPIRIVPPWWNSLAAWVVYVFASILVLLLIARALQRRRRRELAYTDELRRREEHLKMALWGSGDDLWDLDVPAHSLRRLNAESIHELDPLDEQISVTDWRSSVVHPEDLAEVEERMRQHILGHTAHFESEHRIRNAQGEWVKVLVRGKVVERDSAGRATRVAGTARDMTRMDHAERERRIASEVLNSMTEAVTVVDLDFRFVSVNHAFSHITGYAEDEVIGVSSSMLDSSQHPPQFYQQMRAAMRQTGRWSGEMWQRRKDDEEFLCAIEAVEVIEPDGKRGYFVAVLNDITEKKRAEQELRYLANFDTLTGLPNRALLSERLARAIVRARRQDTLVGVLFLDLDRFKEINDSLGHTAGDRILKAVAARLQSIAGPSDTVSRLGGDEFTIVLEDLVSAEAAFEVARKLLACFATPLMIDDRSEISITPSVGISLYPAHGLAPTDLLKHADSAMYQAKANGRNTYLVYTEAMETEARRRANLTAALRRALDRDEFQLLFQPRLSLTSGRITGVEALLRWHSEELGEVMPTAFIPVAEETGMILRIGEWVMRDACRALAAWQANGLQDISMAINVSVLQLLRGNLPQLLAKVLEESGAPANRLELELTESMVMANAAETRSMLNQLRQLGVSLAIDDFGTGYSSLVYLKQLPIDMLKIDKEFIDDLTRDPDDEAITTTIITMAHSLGLNVIAEGVESQAQLDFLRKHGCDEIQGFWLSPPLDDEHCQAFIHSWQHTRNVLPGAPVARLQ